ncbi:GtrA family protein [Burkholderia vietnamiensis]|uniref:GtrA family protein n=1 Tax=Burkholderia vietnamiensis TaxID=60552 RepID=UPI0020126F79|nr:GtrA family protein [Burkholderia vietnamiensis]
MYSLFAAISIAANIGAQKLYLIIAPPFHAITLSVFVGTAAGLILKFMLDKVWIFRYEHRDFTHGVTSFLLYAAMGVATTAIFWGFEFSADMIFGTEASRLTAGTIGLVLGYLVKYRLDKKFVFA